MRDLRNVPYPQDLKTLKSRFESFESEFKLRFPLYDKNDILNHYIQHYQSVIDSIKASEAKTGDYISKGLSLVKNESDKIMLDKFEKEQNQIHDKLLNQVPEYNRMIQWLKNQLIRTQKEKLKGFDFKGSESSAVNLYSILFKSYIDCDYDDFKEVIYSQNLSQCDKNISLLCKNVEAVFLFDALEPYFKAFTYKMIEESKIFLTKSGKPIKNLSNSKLQVSSRQKNIYKSNIHDLLKKI